MLRINYLTDVRCHAIIAKSLRVVKKRQKRGNGHTLLQLDEAVGFADDYKKFGDILKAIKSHKKALEILEKSLAID